MLTAIAEGSNVILAAGDMASTIFIPEATDDQAPEIDDVPLITLDDITGEALHDLGQVINDINRANGWSVCRPFDFSGEDDEDGHGRYKIPAVIALCHSELSEALEAYRKGDKDNFIEEMADTFIRILDCTHGLGMDLSSAVFAKLAKNRTRGYRHGGKRV